MNLLFIHDHKFRMINGDLYSIGGLSNEILSYYVDIFGSITVLARITLCNDTGDQTTTKLSKIINEKVNVLSWENLKRSDVNSLVVNHSSIILRLPSLIGLRILPCIARNKKKFFVEVVGCAWDSFWNHSFRGKVVAPFIWIKTKYWISKADYALYVTNSFLQKRYPNSNSISCSDVRIEVASQVQVGQRISNFGSNKRIIIGTIGSVDISYKGQEYIIKALGKKYKEAHCKYEYQLVGSGDGYRLKKLIKKYNLQDNVKFIGSIPFSEVKFWMDQIDIYAQPSTVEGLARSIIEAMSRGCPCIGSNIGGNPELINNNCLFRPRNILSIINVLDKFEQFNFFETMVEYSLNKAKDFTPEALMDKRTAFYTDYYLYSLKGK